MFPLSACDEEFFAHFVAALQRYSSFTVGDFTDNNNQEHRHSFEFTEALATSWMRDADEELRQELPWEFAVCPERHTAPHSGWRVHGIILEDVFYIVWLDPDHLVFIDGRYHPKEKS
jgi:homoserine trans-succinylase